MYNTERISINLSPEFKEEIIKVCETRHITISDLVRFCLRAYLEHLKRKEGSE